MRIVFTLLFLTGLIAFSKNSSRNFKQDDPAHHMVYLEGGTIEAPRERSVADSTGVNRFLGKSVASFYLSAYELTNYAYLQYLHDLNQKDQQKFNSALPDTTVWNAPLASSQVYVDYYLRHPAYANYPVVGVSHQQAELFCEWLTETYNANPKRKHKKVQFRLPTELEWYYAALAAGQCTKKKQDAAPVYYCYGSRFPWKSMSLQSSEFGWHANFKPFDQACIQLNPGRTQVEGKSVKDLYYVGEPNYAYGSGSILIDDAFFTAPVYAFTPGALGLCNMAGNVEEFVAEYGITKGGSWNDSGYYLLNWVSENYDADSETTAMRGFRIAMDVLDDF